MDSPYFQMTGLTRSELYTCRQAMKTYQPFAVIHYTACTAVDKAESELDEAFRVNGDGSRNIAVPSQEAIIKAGLISYEPS